MADGKDVKKKKSHIFIKLLLLILIIVLLFILYSKYIGVKGLIVKEYRVESDILTENFSGIKIIHFSDLLYKSTVDKDDIKKMVNRMNELKPDIVVFTGDLVDISKKITEDDKNFLIKELSSINAKISKYAIYGDYDFSFKYYDEIMNKSGFKMLNNSYDEIYYKNNDNIYIVGIPSSIKANDSLQKAYEFYSDKDRKYIITLVHDGKTIKYLDNSSYETDLILGGHSLNGSIVIPFYGGIFIDDASYKYYDEQYKKGITNIFISSGLGTKKYNYRFNNKPSFNLYRLKAQP